MSELRPPAAAGNRVLVKLRASAALHAAGSTAQLRPLHEARATAFGLGAHAEWYIAQLDGGGASPWDLAHARVADQLGVAPSDVLFAEPDLVHDVYVDDAAGGPGFGVAGTDCGTAVAQEAANGKAVGSGFAWHLGRDFSQLGDARAAVAFTTPRTRIAHLDTGYDRRHVTVPRNIDTDRQRNFAREGTLWDAADPDGRTFLLPDNTGHGTGTLGILAGGVAAEYGPDPIGGAPEAEILPLRVADSVMLLRTSAFAEALGWATDEGCDVVTMSMGGLPMRTWREEIDRAYNAGVCVVAAAGNNMRKLPTRHLVYPARYGRVIAACGVMADGRPYHDLSGGEMQGNYGPDSVMESALAAYTPNIPWAVYGCSTKLRLNGAGTSSATPQIAAAAALWFEKYKTVLPRNWRRVEAVRHALFTTATAAGSRTAREKLGNGVLQALAALAMAPRLDLPQTKADRDFLAALRVITGIGLVEPTPREAMFDLEFAQRWLVNAELQKALPDPAMDATLGEKELRKLLDALIGDDGASLALRRQAAARYPVVTKSGQPRRGFPTDVVPPETRACEPAPRLSPPATRKLRVFAMDPSFSGRLDTAEVSDVTLHVRWEPLAPGPTGEYIAVDDTDATGHQESGVDLDAPALLAQGGWRPAEGNPHFHQQMVYAVAMNTIAHFERALGRPVLWRPTRGGDPAATFVQRLVIRPHALQQANAFYSPERNALEFGYFDATADGRHDLVPGSRVYTCLSHDIIVHETTHAILDGMHRHFSTPSNPDVLALHEGFADIVALLQHFTIPELLHHEIGRTRGDLSAESVLGSLAVQFGQAVGRGGALREAIGTMRGGAWHRLEPDPAELQKRLAPHARGAILVAAVFDAFVAIHRTRSADLLRLYTGGTGVLPAGAVHPDLVRRLAEEAAKSASHVLTMCIRALDYLPPVDVTFFEYLRAVLTADHDMVRDDRYNYRVAFVEAFRRRGIHSHSLGDRDSTTPRNLAVGTLLWQGLDMTAPGRDSPLAKAYGRVVESLKEYAGRCLYIADRRTLHEQSAEARATLHEMLVPALRAAPAFARDIGIDAERPFDVEEVRAALRVRADGRHAPQAIVSLVQDHADPEHGAFRSGSTLVVDLEQATVRYRIVKNVRSPARLARTRAFHEHMAADPLRALLLAGGDEPFAALHTVAGSGG